MGVDLGVDLDRRLDELQPQSAENREFQHTQRLVLSAVLRGLVLDDPWRHAYLRHRWTGIDGKGHHATQYDRRDD